MKLTTKTSPDVSGRNCLPVLLLLDQDGMATRSGSLILHSQTDFGSATKLHCEMHCIVMLIAPSLSHAQSGSLSHSLATFSMLASVHIMM